MEPCETLFLIYNPFQMTHVSLPNKYLHSQLQKEKNEKVLICDIRKIKTSHLYFVVSLHMQKSESLSEMEPKTYLIQQQFILKFTNLNCNRMRHPPPSVCWNLSHVLAVVETQGPPTKVPTLSPKMALEMLPDLVTLKTTTTSHKNNKN